MADGVTVSDEGKARSASATTATHGLFDIFGPAAVSPVVLLLFVGSAPLSRVLTYAVMHSCLTIAFPVAIWLIARQHPELHRPAETVWALIGSVVVAAMPWIILPETLWSHYALGFLFTAIMASDTLFMALRPSEPWRLMLALPTLSFASYLVYAGSWTVGLVCVAVALHLAGGRDMVEQLVNRLRDQSDQSDLLARTDPLTGLQNRRGLSHYLEEARSRNDAIVVAAIDIDDFKQINDRLGHHAGDAALVQLATHMTSALGSDWSVARSGGDEFMCVSTVGSFSDARGALRRLPSLLFEDTVMPLRVSVGLASGPAEETLLADASAALRLSKKRGKHRFTEVDDQLRDELRKARELGTQLADAVRRREIEIWAQPIVHLSGPEAGRVHSYECLARWATPDGTFIPPSTFIPMVEDQRLTTELGESVISKAAELISQLPGHLSVSVNVSASHFTLPGFTEFLLATVERHKIEPHRLTIEITESEDIPVDSQTSAVARQLRQLGIGLSIDDFGTGYASLERLVSFPCSQLKLDRSIIGASDRPGVGHLLSGFSKLSSESGIEVVAEGIETQKQVALLSEAGLPLGQGYLFGRPEPVAATIERYVQDDGAFRLPDEDPGYDISTLIS